MYWTPFLVRILDSTVFTRLQKRSWVNFNVFTPDHNRTIIQISNLIFPSRKCFTSFKCFLLCSSLSREKSSLNMLLPFQSFRIFFVSIISQLTDDCPELMFFLFLGFFAPWALFMIIFPSVFSFSPKSFSTSASQSAQLSPPFP